MANDEKSGKKPRIRKVETVRERAEKSQNQPVKRRRIRKVASVGAKPFKTAAKVGRKEYYPINVRGKGRISTFFNKKRRWVPKYFRQSWQELKQVIWASSKETIRLTWAVFIFAIVFGTVITLTDFGLEKVFKRIILR